MTKEDVLRRAIGSGGAGRAATAGAEVKPIRGPAATLARFMDESRSIPTATSFRTARRSTCSTRAAASSRRPGASSASPT